MIAVSKPWRLKVNDWNYFGKLRLVLQCLGEVTETTELGISSKDLLQPLLDGLRANDWKILKKTEKSLVMLGTAIPLEIRLAITNRLLVDLLDNRDNAHEAALTLGKLGVVIPVTIIPSIINQLLDAFRRNDWEFKRRIMFVLEDLGTTIPIDMRTSVVNELLPACQDNDIGPLAVRTLGKLGTIIPVEIVPSVVNQLLDAVRLGGGEAIEVLGKLSSIIPIEMLPLVVNSLLDDFRSRDWYLPTMSLRALSTVTPIEIKTNVVKPLLNVLQDKKFSDQPYQHEVIVSLRTLGNAIPVALMPDVINECLSVLLDSRQCCVIYNAIALLDDLAVMVPAEMRLTVIDGLSTTLDRTIKESVEESDEEAKHCGFEYNLLKNLAAVVPIEVKPKVINQLLPPSIKVYTTTLSDGVIPLEFIPKIVDGLFADLDAMGCFTCGCIKKFVVESLENIVNIIPKEMMPNVIDKLLSYLHNHKGHEWYVASKPLVLRLLVKLNTIVPEVSRPKLVDGILAALRDKGEITRKNAVIELVKLCGEKELIKKLIIKCEQYTTSIDADIRKPAIDELKKLLQGIINGEVSSTDVLAHVNSALEFSDNPIFSTWVGESDVRIIFEQCQGLLSELK